MKLTHAERLILIMLAELHEKVGVQNGTDTKLVKTAIYSDNTWALDWEMSGIVGDEGEPTPPEVSEVVDTLDMWSFMEEAYSNFDQPSRDRIVKEAAPFGADVKFQGFDGNNETKHLGIARMLIDDMGRFKEFQKRDLNSHIPSMNGYRKMIAAFDEIRPNLDGRGLNPDEIIELLKARRAH